MPVVDDDARLGVVVVRAWIEIVRADHRKAVVHHDRLGVQAEAAAFAEQGGWLAVAAMAAQQVEARLPGAGRRGGFRCRRHRIHAQVGQFVVDRRGHRVRLHLVDLETELGEVALAVLVRHGIHGERVGGCQRIGRHHDARRFGALVQPAENLLRLVAHHQVRRLQQYLAFRAGDHVHDVAGEYLRACPLGRAGLGRHVAEVIHVADFDARRDQPRMQPRRILRGLLHLRHAQRSLVLRWAPGWRLGVGQDALVEIAQVGQRHGAAVVPEQVETVGHLARRRPGDHHVAVDVIEVVIPVEVAVLVVASAGDADAVVHQQQLVVHALVELHEAADHARGEFQRRRAGVVEGGVVQPHVQVDAGAHQPVEQVEVVEGEQLVGQDAHLHAASRRLHQLVQHQLAGVVLGPDEGLHVDRLARGAHQVHPRGQRRLAVVEQGDHMHRLLRRGLGQRAVRRLQQRRGLGAMVGLLAGELAVDGVGHRQVGLVDFRARHGAALQQQGCE